VVAIAAILVGNESSLRVWQSGSARSGAADTVL
jgi:hypothetical protein